MFKKVRIADLDVNYIEGDQDGNYTFLLHGYGANAKDLISLHTYLQPSNQPKYNWFFLEAPISLDDNFLGKAWFPIPEIMTFTPTIDYSNTEPNGMASAREKITQVIKQVTHAQNKNKIILGGFSQGAVMSMDVFLHLPKPNFIRGVLLFSGTIVNKTGWSKMAKESTPFHCFQSHGKNDPLLTYAKAKDLCDLIKQAGITLDWYDFDGGHEITMNVMDRAKSYLENI